MWPSTFALSWPVQLQYVTGRSRGRGGREPQTRVTAISRMLTERERPGIAQARRAEAVVYSKGVLLTSDAEGDGWLAT